MSLLINCKKKKKISDEILPILNKSFQRIEEEVLFLNVFNVVSTILVSKLDKDIIRKI